MCAAKVEENTDQQHTINAGGTRWLNTSPNLLIGSIVVPCGTKRFAVRSIKVKIPYKICQLTVVKQIFFVTSTSFYVTAGWL